MVERQQPAAFIGERCCPAAGTTGAGDDDRPTQRLYINQTLVFLVAARWALRYLEELSKREGRLTQRWQ